VHVRCVQIVEFRNYRTLAYSPSPRLNVLTGRNAQGKSNLLEAIAVLVAGRSYRTSRAAELPRWGASSAQLAGELGRGDGVRTVRRTLQPREDGSWQVSGDGCEWARVVPFGWQDLAILNGAPAARRSFLDGFTGRLYPGHLATLARYRTILARRTVVLRARQADRLGPWDEALAGAGTELLKRRLAAVGALQAELARIYPALAGEPGRVEIGYRSSLGPAVDAPAFVRALESRRAEELRRGQTVVGPHRDDLAIELGGVDARVFGSRGQQRLLALALRLAEVAPVTEAVGTAPVLLLDDALSELDPQVRRHVLRESRTAGQVFLTTAEAEPPAGDAAIWEVKEGGLLAV
jgi:DNA replication and repair protein RecF